MTRAATGEAQSSRRGYRVGWVILGTVFISGAMWIGLFALAADLLHRH